MPRPPSLGVRGAGLDSALAPRPNTCINPMHAQVMMKAMMASAEGS